MLNCPHERGIFLTLTVAVWTQSTSVTQRLSCSKHTTTVVSPPVSQEVSQEAIAAIGHVWTVLCHQGAWDLPGCVLLPPVFSSSFTFYFSDSCVIYVCSYILIRKGTWEISAVGSNKHVVVVFSVLFCWLW